MSYQSAFAAQAARISPPSDVTQTAVTGASSAAVATGAPGQVIMFSSDVDFHIVFGTSAVAAADTDSVKLRAGVLYPLTVDVNRSHFRVISAGADGSLWHYVGSP